MDRRAREPAAIDNACVVQLVAEDRVVAAGERGNDADIRGVAAAEDEGGLRPFVLGEPGLELLVGWVVADDQPRRGCSRPALARGARRRLGKRGMAGEVEAVVGREIQQLAPFRRDELRASACERAQAPEQPLLLAFGERLREEDVPLAR